jgi:predicted nucleic-acid-binding protein
MGGPVIALDTNVLVRFLVKDDVRQWEACKSLVDATLARGDGLFVGHVVLCELAWVLASVYDHTREEVRAALRAVAASGNVTVEAVDEVHRALDAHARGQGDVSDYLIREHALRAGCDVVVTFDRKLLKEPVFRAP